MPKRERNDDPMQDAVLHTLVPPHHHTRPHTASTHPAEAGYDRPCLEIALDDLLHRAAGLAALVVRARARAALDVLLAVFAPVVPVVVGCALAAGSVLL